jgi:hypothetical protein
MNRYFVKADDVREDQIINVYVECIADDFGDNDESDFFRSFDYSRDGRWNRAQARAQALSVASQKAAELQRVSGCPCDFGANW